jgi:hypothetical protein
MNKLSTSQLKQSDSLTDLDSTKLNIKSYLWNGFFYNWRLMQVHSDHILTFAWLNMKSDETINLKTITFLSWSKCTITMIHVLIRAIFHSQSNQYRQIIQIDGSRWLACYFTQEGTHIALFSIFFTMTVCAR